MKSENMGIFKWVNDKLLDNDNTPDLSDLNNWDTQLFFIYGTLRMGHSRNDLLQSAEFRNFGFTEDSNYRMHYNVVGGFPTVYKDVLINPGRIFGEVWEVPVWLIPHLDNIESNGLLYTRKKTNIIYHNPDDPDNPFILRNVWMYIGNQKAQRRYNWYDLKTRKSDLFGDYYGYSKEIECKGIGKVAAA